MSVLFILKNGKRITMRDIPPEYLEQLLRFNIFAGYVLRSHCCDPVRWP